MACELPLSPADESLSDDRHREGTPARRRSAMTSQASSRSSMVAQRSTVVAPRAQRRARASCRSTSRPTCSVERAVDLQDDHVGRRAAATRSRGSAVGRRCRAARPGGSGWRQAGTRAQASRRRSQRTTGRHRRCRRARAGSGRRGGASGSGAVDHDQPVRRGQPLLHAGGQQPDRAAYVCDRARRSAGRRARSAAAAVLGTGRTHRPYGRRVWWKKKPSSGSTRSPLGVITWMASRPRSTPGRPVGRGQVSEDRTVVQRAGLPTTCLWS